MIKGVAIALLRWVDTPGQNLLVEPCADLLHRLEYLLIALYPGNIVRPASSLHVEIAVLLFELLDNFFKGVRPGAVFELLPDAVLHNRLDSGEALSFDAYAV